MRLVTVIGIEQPTFVVSRGVVTLNDSRTVRPVTNLLS
jgi:hypothetical protein